VPDAISLKYGIDDPKAMGEPALYRLSINKIPRAGGVLGAGWPGLRFLSYADSQTDNIIAKI
jgi:hypothetical protein